MQPCTDRPSIFHRLPWANMGNRRCRPYGEVADSNRSMASMGPKPDGFPGIASPPATACPISVDLPADTPLLWVLRDEIGLTGTKFGCGMALCGACTVHIDGQPERACVTPISSLTNKKVITIEAIGADKVGKRIRQLPIGDQLRI